MLIGGFGPRPIQNCPIHGSQGNGVGARLEVSGSIRSVHIRQIKFTTLTVKTKKSDPTGGESYAGESLNCCAEGAQIFMLFQRWSCFQILEKAQEFAEMVLFLSKDIDTHIFGDVIVGVVRQLDQLFILGNSALLGIDNALDHR